MAIPKHRPAEAADERAGHLREVGVDADPEPPRVGEDLAEVRLHQGGDLQAIAEDLRIRYDHLLALEEGRFDDLPGPTYVVGFLRSYATYLGLDAEDLVQRFKAEAADFGVQPKLHFPSPAEEGRVPTASLLLFAIALAGAAYAGWYYVTSIEYVTADRVPEVPGRLAELAPPPETSSTVASQTLALTLPPDASAGPDETETATGEDAAAETAIAAVPQDTEAAAVPEPVALLESAEADPEAPPSAPSVTVVEMEPTAPGGPTVTVVETASTAQSESSASEAPQGADDARVEIRSAAIGASVATASTDTTPARRPPTRAPATSSDRASEPVDVAPAASSEEAAVPTETEPVTASGGAAAPSESADTEEITTAAATVDIPPPVIDSGDYVPRVFGQGNAGSRIQVRATEEVWVQITGADDELLLTRILRPGDVYHVPDRPGLVLMTGNAAGVEIIVDGKVAPPLGPVGAVRRDVPLDPVALLHRPETDIR